MATGDGREKVVGGGGESDTNMVFYLYVRMGKHRLKWLQRCFRGDTLSVIMTHRPASCHFFPPAGTTCSSRAHKHTHTHKHTHMVGWCGKSVRGHTSENKHTPTHTDTHTHKSVTLVLHCVAYWLCSIHHTMTGQSLLIRATSASTEKSMVKYINKNTIKAIERRRGNKWPAGGTPPASRGR